MYTISPDLEDFEASKRLKNIKRTKVHVRDPFPSHTLPIYQDHAKEMNGKRNAAMNNSIVINNVQPISK